MNFKKIPDTSNTLSFLETLWLIFIPSSNAVNVTLLNIDTITLSNSITNSVLCNETTNKQCNS